MLKFSDWIKEDVSGMGPVIAAQPGAIPGTTGTTGTAISGGFLGPYSKTPYKTVFDTQEKTNKALRLKTTDQSNGNKIKTKPIDYGYKSLDLFKKIKKTSAGLNPWLDFADNLPDRKTANVLKTNVKGLKEDFDFFFK